MGPEPVHFAQLLSAGLAGERPMSHEVVTPGGSIGERAAHAVANPELQQAMRNLDVRLPTARIVADHLRR